MPNYETLEAAERPSGPKGRKSSAQLRISRRRKVQLIYEELLRAACPNESPLELFKLAVKWVNSYAPCRIETDGGGRLEAQTDASCMAVDHALENQSWKLLSDYTSCNDTMFEDGCSTLRNNLVETIIARYR